MKMLITIDDALIAGIDAVSAKRSAFVRDAIYTAVWNAKRDGLALRSAPLMPPYLERMGASADMRVIDSKVVKVDEFGLVTAEGDG